jgi:hypothetical protein
MTMGRGKVACVHMRKRVMEGHLKKKSIWKMENK